MDRITENVFEWIVGQDRITVTLSQKKHVNRLKRLAEQYPDEVDCYENKDGSVYGHIPLTWLRFSKPREMTDEQKRIASERLRNIRNSQSTLNKST